jgi:hypothetical protein
MNLSQVRHIPSESDVQHIFTSFCTGVLVPSDLGNLKYLRMPAEVEKGSRMATTVYTLPRNLHYVKADPELLLVLFFGDLGLM